jgi:hypothetical protein
LQLSSSWIVIGLLQIQSILIIIEKVIICIHVINSKRRIASSKSSNRRTNKNIAYRFFLIIITLLQHDLIIMSVSKYLKSYTLIISLNENIIPSTPFATTCNITRRNMTKQNGLNTIILCLLQLVLQPL